MGIDFVRREVSEELYSSTVLFLIGGDEVTAEFESKEWFKQKGIESLSRDCEGEDADGRTFQGSSLHFVCWRRDMSDLGTMVHELVHVGTALFGILGIPIKEECDEPFAYYLGWLASKCPMYQTILHS